MFIQVKKVQAEIAELSKNPQGLLLERIHSAGFSGALRNPLLASEEALNRLNGNLLEEFVTVRQFKYIIDLILVHFYVSSLSCVTDMNESREFRKIILLLG